MDKDKTQNDGGNVQFDGKDFLQEKKESQPIVNKEAVKAKADNAAKQTKNFFNNFLEKLKTNKKTAIITVVVLLLVIFLLVPAMKPIFSPSYGVVNRYMSGLKKHNSEKVLKTLNTDLLGVKDEDDYIDALDKKFKDLDKNDKEISKYKVRDCYKYNKEQVKDFGKLIERTTDDDIDRRDIKSVKKYYVRVNTKTEDGKGLAYKTIIAYKCEGKWYVIDVSEDIFSDFIY